MDPSTHTGPRDEDFYMAALWDAARPVASEVPGYTILDEISKGGMGVVYHALQLRPEREVALKVLLPEFADQPEMLARFQLEARAMAVMDHAGILPVYEVGEAGGMPFFSMKLATGGSLSDRLLRGPLPAKEAASMMIELTRAVHHAHQHGVLHRDLKPGNLLFLDDGRACVSDFGLAKLSLSDQGPLTRTEAFFGTPHYMPPEVAAGSVADATVAGDLYSMGAVLYECLGGRRPHASKENIAGLLRAIADDPVVSPDVLKSEVPRDLAIICMKALERKPADRYATLGDFADDLERWMEGRPIKARRVGALEAGWRWAVRHPLSSGLFAALLVVSATGSVLLAVSHHQRGEALIDARSKLQRSLIEQARAERLLGLPGHREIALAGLGQAAEIGRSQEIRDEAAAVLARPDLSPLPERAAVSTGASILDGSEDEVVADRKSSPNEDFNLTTYDSGAARLWRKDLGQTLKEWNPPPGRAIIGDFTPDGNSVILAETVLGTIVENVLDQSAPQVLAPPGLMIGFLTIDPVGRRVALAGEGGVNVLNLSGGGWHWGDAQARCAAAWSGDGSRLAVAAGERREVFILAAGNGGVCSTVPVTGVPQQIAFAPDGSLLAVASDDGMVSLCDAATGVIWCPLPFQAGSLRFSNDGRKLMAHGGDGLVHSWRVSPPVAFHAWSEAARAKADGTVFGMALSPDGSRLVTMSNGCVAVWSVAEERQTGVHRLENQRIDVRTSAWWMGEREILLQVPGGWEKLILDADGRPGESIRLPKVPGCTVLDVRPDGSWLVSLTDEDGELSFERWSGGDPDRAEAAEPPPVAPAGITAEAGRWSASLQEGGVVEVRSVDGGRMRLVPPGNLGVRALGFSHDGTRLIVLSRLHQVFTWDLSALSKTLDELGF